MVALPFAAAGGEVWEESDENVMLASSRQSKTHPLGGGPIICGRINESCPSFRRIMEKDNGHRLLTVM